MNIVIIPSFFRTKNNSTLGNFFWEQALALKKHGHTVTILYCDTYSVKKISEFIHYAEDCFIDEEGISIYRAKRFCIAKHGLEGYRKAYERCILKLFEQYLFDTNEKVDMVHAHCCMWAGSAAFQIKERYGIPYVITEHATIFQLYPERISKKNEVIIARLFKTASQVICVSKGLKQIIRKYVEEIDVVGNVVDCTFFKLEDMKKKNQKFTFFSLCYMQTELQLLKKGMDVLIQATKHLQASKNEFCVMLGGGGNALSKAKEWIREAGVEKNIELLGALDRPQVLERMQACDCFVLPSRYETFGVVYIEAMACGKPVIGVKNGGPDGFVDKTNGILLEEISPEILADAMKYMMNNRELYNSEEIRKKVQERFSQESIAKQLSDVYQRIVKRE